MRHLGALLVGYLADAAALEHEAAQVDLQKHCSAFRPDDCLSADRPAIPGHDEENPRGARSRRLRQKGQREGIHLVSEGLTSLPANAL